MSDSLFSTKNVAQRKQRYTLADGARATAEGGRVGVGVDANGAAFLVHVIGRQTEAVALHAVATAIAGGAIPAAAIVAAFAETGKLDALKKAIDKAPA